MGPFKVSGDGGFRGGGDQLCLQPEGETALPGAPSDFSPSTGSTRPRPTAPPLRTAPQTPTQQVQINLTSLPGGLSRFPTPGWHQGPRVTSHPPNVPSLSRPETLSLPALCSSSASPASSYTIASLWTPPLATPQVLLLTCTTKLHSQNINQIPSHVTRLQELSWDPRASLSPPWSSWPPIGPCPAPRPSLTLAASVQPPLILSATRPCLAGLLRDEAPVPPLVS